MCAFLDSPQNRLTLLVPEDLAVEPRLDRFLAECLADLSLSRVRVKQLIQTGAVTVNGTPQSKPACRLVDGDTVTIDVPEAQPVALVSEELALDIVYEDTDLLVVNKPAGMLTHPTGREQTGTLVNALLHYCHGRLSGINGVIRPGIVHRLDRETSGLLMVAKTDRAHHGLAQQLKDKTARRNYWALVQGVFPELTGTVSAPIGRNPKHRQKMEVTPTGRHAVTHWTVLETFQEKFSLLELSLETGRTHQIRVHLAHQGHPILGDPLYGSGVEKLLKLKTQGQLLQAFCLAFQHPVTGEAMRFEIPMETEMTSVLEQFRTG